MGSHQFRGTNCSYLSHIWGRCSHKELLHERYTWKKHLRLLIRWQKWKAIFFKLPKVVGNMNPSHFFLLPTLNGSTGGPYQSCSGISCGDTWEPTYVSQELIHPRHLSLFVAARCSRDGSRFYRAVRLNMPDIVHVNLIQRFKQWVNQ